LCLLAALRVSRWFLRWLDGPCRRLVRGYCGGRGCAGLPQRRHLVRVACRPRELRLGNGWARLMGRRAIERPELWRVGGFLPGILLPSVLCNLNRVVLDIPAFRLKTPTCCQDVWWCLASAPRKPTTGLWRG